MATLRGGCEARAGSHLTPHAKRVLAGLWRAWRPCYKGAIPRIKLVTDEPSKKSAFEGIVAGLTDAIAIVRGEADPASYRVHYPKDPADWPSEALAEPVGGDLSPKT